MSWSGSVYCGHCGKEGHNRRGCPTLKEYIKDNPDSYHATQAKYQAERAKNRRCGYCNEVGHTRRTCSDKQTHITEFGQRNREFARGVASWLKAEGMEPGTLIKVKESVWDNVACNYNDKELMYLITGISYHEINYESMNRLGYRYSSPEVIMAKRIGGTNGLRTFGLPFHEEYNRPDRRYGTPDNPLAIVSKVKSTGMYPADMPDAFLTGYLGVKELFDGGKQKDKRQAYESTRLADEYKEVQAAIHREKAEKS